jgi:hypothetical protein
MTPAPPLGTQERHKPAFQMVIFIKMCGSSRHFKPRGHARPQLLSPFNIFALLGIWENVGTFSGLCNIVILLTLLGCI